MKGVKIKQAKYFMQVIKQNQLPYLLNKEKEVFDTVYKAIRDNKLFNDVGNIIEKEANRISNEECAPEWKRIGDEMNKLNEERNELDKKEDKTEEENDRIKEISDKISELSSEAEKVWQEANIRLNKFKDDLIDGEYKDTNCFDLHDKEYDLVNRVIGWSVYDWQVEWNVIAPN